MAYSTPHFREYPRVVTFSSATGVTSGFPSTIYNRVALGLTLEMTGYGSYRYARVSTADQDLDTQLAQAVRWLMHAAALTDSVMSYITSLLNDGNH